jgi:hypothetical protein
MDDALTLYSSRFFKSVTDDHDIKDKGKLQMLLGEDKRLTQAIAQTLSQLNAVQVSVADIGGTLDAAFHHKNLSKLSQHVG